MTKEESKAILQTMEYELSNQVGSAYCRKKYDAVKIAIKALEKEPCEDAVSRQAVLNTLFYKSDNNCEVVLNKELQDRIKALPPVTPQPKTGYWILADEQNEEDVENDNYRFICSECQCSDIHTKGTIVPYCWKCGAKMEEEEC